MREIMWHCLSMLDFFYWTWYSPSSCFATNDNVPFSPMAAESSILFTYHIFFIPSVCWWTPGLIPCLVYWKSSVTHTGVQVCLQYNDFSSFTNLLSGTAGSYASPILNVLRKLHIIFHSDCTSVHSFQKCIRLPSFPNPRRGLHVQTGRINWSCCPWNAPMCEDRIYPSINSHRHIGVILPVTWTMYFIPCV